MAVASFRASMAAMALAAPSSGPHDSATDDLAKQFVATYGPHEMHHMSFSVSNGSGWATDIGHELASRFVAHYNPVSESHDEFSDKFQHKYVPTAYSGFLQKKSSSEGDHGYGAKTGENYMKQWGSPYINNGSGVHAYPGGSYWHQYGNPWTSGVSLVAVPNMTLVNQSDGSTNETLQQREAQDREHGEELARQFVAAYGPSEMQNLPFNVTNGSAWAHDMGRELARRFTAEHAPANTKGKEFEDNFTAKYVPEAYQGYIHGKWNPEDFVSKNAESDLSATAGSTSGATFVALLVGVFLVGIALATANRRRMQAQVPAESKVHLLA